MVKCSCVQSYTAWGSILCDPSTKWCVTRHTIFSILVTFSISSFILEIYIQHDTPIDIFFNNEKFKIVSCGIDESNGILTIKTKVFDQSFPHNGHFTIAIPSQNTDLDVAITFHTMWKNSAIKLWKYAI